MNNKESAKLENEFSLIAHSIDIVCSEPTIEAAFSKICTELGKLTDSKAAIIFSNIPDDQGAAVRCLVRGSWAAEGTPPFESEFLFSFMNAGSQELMLVNHIRDSFKTRSAVQIHADEFPASLHPFMKAHAFQVACLMPIYMKNSIWGEIVLTSDDSGKNWDEMDCVLLKSLAEVLPSGLERFKDELTHKEMQIEQAVLFENRIAGNILHRNDRIIRISKTALALLGGTEEDYLGAIFIDTVIHPKSREKILTRRARLETQQGTLEPIEAVLKKKNGSAMDVLITAAWQKVEDSIIINSTFFDITSIKARERLFQAVTTISSAMSSLTSIQHIMKIFLDAIQQAFPYADCAGYVHLADSDVRKLVATCDLEPALEQFIWQTAQSERLIEGGESALLLPAPTPEKGANYLFQPVRSSNNLIGTIFLNYHDNEPPAPEERSNLHALAEAIFNAAQKFLLMEQNEARYKNLAVLYKASLELGKLRFSSDIATKALQILEEEKGWTHSVIRIKDEASQRLVTLSYCAPDVQEHEGKKIIEWLNTKINKPGDGLTGWVIEHSEPVICKDLPHDPRYIETDIGMKFGIYAPIHAEGMTIGAIGVESEYIDFSPADLELLASLGDLIGMALNAVRNMELLGYRVHWLEQLYEAGTAVTLEASEDMIYYQLLDGAMEALSAEAGALMLYQKESNLLIPVAKRGWLTDLVDPIAPDTSLSGLVFSTGRSHISWELNQDVAILSPIREKIPDDKRAIAVPILAESTVIGVFHLAFSTDVHINKDIVAVAELFASFTGTVLQRFELSLQLQKSHDALKDAYDATLEGWSRAIGLRDDETASHGERVTSLAVAIGRKMNLSPEMMEALRRGALLHDIGKIGIPDRILLKQGSLSNEERTIMQTHPMLAYRLLQPIAFLKDAITIPYCHHERWDGTGYPQGLKGEEIPLLARIFAIADVYDAMTSDRPYRKALSHEDAVSYIQANAGSHFDPAVVKAFLALSRMLE